MRWLFGVDFYAKCSWKAIKEWDGIPICQLPQPVAIYYLNQEWMVKKKVQSFGNCGVFWPLPEGSESLPICERFRPTKYSLYTPSQYIMHKFFPPFQEVVSLEELLVWY